MITTYTFTLPKKNNNTSANNFKESLAEKFLNAYPWLGGKKEKRLLLICICWILFRQI